MKTFLIALLFLPAIASASDTWQSGEYRYDGAGNIIGIGNDSYVYDSVSRLSHSIVNTANESYVYDAFGNLVTKTTDGRLETVPPVDSSTNRVTTASYDTAGNMTSSGDATYVYDPLNMMVRIDTSYARRRYIYTVDDERIGVQTDPTFTRWTVRDFGGKVLREFRADSINAWTWTEDYIYRDGQLVAAEQPGTSGGLRHFSLDHLGTTRLITNTPAPGETPVAYGRHDFFPFGMEQTPTNQEVVNHSSERPEAMKFTGHQRDFLGDWYTDNSDYLDYMHARYYNPVMGRFLSVDPFLGQPFSPQSWNRYSYALNSPLNISDPSGREPCKITLTGEAAEKAGLADGTVVDGDCSDVNDNVPTEAEQVVDVAVETIDMTMFDIWCMLGGANIHAGLYNDNLGQIATGYGQQLLAAAPGGIGAGLRPLSASGSLIFSEGSALLKASQAAIAAAESADAFSVSAKHLAGAGGRYAKFAADVNPSALIKEGLQSRNATFLPNGEGSFQVITNVGHVIGTRGETTIKIVLDYSGKIWTAYPIR